VGSGGPASDGGRGGGNDNGGALAAFIASPAYSHVASAVPTKITAGPVVVSRLGVPCQKMTQNINIGGRKVRASAVLCREPNGIWKIKPTQGTGLARAVPPPQ
jgi:hypothetical protein